MRVTSLSKTERQTSYDCSSIICVALLSLIFLPTGCMAQEPNGYVKEWEETRKQLSEILPGKWAAGDEGGATHFTSDGSMITLNDGDTLRISKYELTDTCRSFDVPHASEVEEEFVVLKLLKRMQNGHENCYAIHFYEVSEEKGLERIGVQYLTSASQGGWVWERELRQQ